MDESAALAELGERLRQASEASPGGVLPFESFMQLALYEPELGYYERSARGVGKRGDFYTSVSVGPLFGELLAYRFAEWLSDLDSPACIVEAGAHDGRLAQDILGWFQKHRPQLFDTLTYWITEPSRRRQQWQFERLRGFDARTQWSASMPITSGIIFSNELLDAFPVRPVRWNMREQSWEELGVAWESGRWVEVAFRRRSDTPAPQLPEGLLAALPDGFTTETSPAAEAWWRVAAEHLRGGYLVAIDYGLTGEEFLLPQRQRGTRRAYRKHRLVTDMLANPGDGDLTAHVNFSRVQSVGEQLGLRTLGLSQQGQFLTETLRQILAEPDTFGPWTPEYSRQFQTLTHPEHLGRSFRWLVQTRDSCPQ